MQRYLTLPELKILVVDNYDSFTWNLVQILEQWGHAEIEVVKNDAVPASYASDFDGILISPGPGLPGQSGISCDIVREFGPTKSILGVCLGCQVIAEVFGGSLYNLGEVRHGMAVTLEADKKEILFKGMKGEIKAGLYHSWAVSPKDLPACIEVTALSLEGVIMALRHKEYNVHGVQFHPESVMTPRGPEMIRNWLEDVKKKETKGNL
jgi:anthranilate synthase component II